MGSPEAMQQAIDSATACMDGERESAITVLRLNNGLDEAALRYVGRVMNVAYLLGVMDGACGVQARMPS